MVKAPRRPPSGTGEHPLWVKPMRSPAGGPVDRRAALAANPGVLRWSWALARRIAQSAGVSVIATRVEATIEKD